MTEGAGTRSIDHQYFVRASPDEVFRSISEADRLVRWLCDTAAVEPRTGGAYRLGWTGGPTHHGTLRSYEPGRSIAFAWSWPGVALEGTVLVLEAEPADDGTILRVRHDGFPRDERWTDLYGGAEWGWTYFAMNLKSVLETGRDLRSVRDG